MEQASEQAGERGSAPGISKKKKVGRGWGEKESPEVSPNAQSWANRPRTGSNGTI